MDRPIQSSPLLKYVEEAQSSPLSGNTAPGKSCACTIKEWGRHMQGPPPPIPPDNVHSIKILSTLEKFGPSKHVGTSTTGKCYGLASHRSSSPRVQILHGLRDKHETL